VIADVGLKIEVANTPTLRIWVCMRTNIDLDETLVTRGLQLSGLRTKKDLVNMALREFIRKNDQKKILELRGKIQWQGDLDLMRQSRV
jgi:Arc/MetJ family transcription regulator